MFKIGDRVKVIRCNQTNERFYDFIGTIETINSDGTAYVYFDQEVYTYGRGPHAFMRPIGRLELLEDGFGYDIDE